MIKIIKMILKIPFYIVKSMIKLILYLLKNIFGYIFGWIPDLDERMSGEEFEEYVYEILKRNHFKKLELTKHSGDYGIDILGEYKGVKYAFQCKLYQKPVGVSAVQQAYAGCVYYQCDQSVVVTNHQFTRQAIALSKTNDVELWDGEMLEKLKRKANRHSLFRHSHHDEIIINCPYQLDIEYLLNEGYASVDLLCQHFHYSQQKAHYILEDLQYHDLISKEDHLGLRELYYLNVEEALQIYHENE